MSERRTVTTYDKVCTAMSILQMQILASDSALNAKAIFGTEYMPTAALQAAHDLLREVLEEVESLPSLTKTENRE